MLYFLLGLLAGVALSAATARSILRRVIYRVRSAERRAQAAERLAEIGSMTGGLAHEIKNPLSTIGLNADLLLESIQDSDLPADQSARLTSRVNGLRREVGRLRGILTDFLEFAGRIQLDAVETDLNQVVSELVDFYHPEADRLGVRIRADLPPGPSVARVDAKLVKQAILNLMLNATQAMAGAGGGAAAASGGEGASGAPMIKELILRVERSVRGEPDDRVCIHVIDTGPGIAPEIRDKIFQPYFTTKSGGSGLGLPMTRRLIEEHGGRVDVYSEPGKGSDFTLVLPVAGPAALSPQAGPSRLAAG